MKEGDVGEVFYLVIEGKLEVSILDETYNKRVPRKLRAGCRRRKATLYADRKRAPKARLECFKYKHPGSFVFEVLNLLYPGDYFGEQSLLTAEPRAATVRSTDVVFFAFNLIA